MPKKKSKRCIVKNCTNRTNEGSFVGGLCSPCHNFITTGQGQFSQMYRNSLGIVLREVGSAFLGEFIQRLDPTMTVQLTVKEIL
jgi:hypothetical protein